MLTWPEPLRTSVRLLRMHPVISTALGGAIVLSLCAVCTGFGAIVAPWFVCELFGVQIAAATGTRRIRGTNWIAAGVVVLCTVVVVAIVAWLSVLEFGPDPATADAADEPFGWLDTVRRVALISGSMLLAVGFIAPFVYAPLILIDRGGRIGGAVIESAWVVGRAPMRHLGIAFVMFLVQILPALLTGMTVARLYERAVTPYGFLLALPLLPFSIALGQGILTASYLEERSIFASPRTVRSRGRQPLWLVTLLSVVVFSPIAALIMLGMSALQPSVPMEVQPPEGGRDVVVERRIAAEPGVVTDVAVPDTALLVRVAGREVTIVASDEDPPRASLEVMGGSMGRAVGNVPRGWSEDVSAVRVVRAVELYDVEIEAGGRTFRARVDGAAVRTDDSFRDRLKAHVPLWALVLILAAFAACGTMCVRALAPLGALRKIGEATGDERRRSAERARMTALRWGLALLPFSIAALVAGVVSIS